MSSRITWYLLTKQDIDYDLKDGSLWEFVILKHDTIEVKKVKKSLFEFEDKDEEQKEVGSFACPNIYLIFFLISYKMFLQK